MGRNDSLTVRQRLDMIRDLLLPDRELPRITCSVCGATRQFGGPCGLCGGRPVIAANFLRAVYEASSVTDPEVVTRQKEAWSEWSTEIGHEKRRLKL